MIILLKKNLTPKIFITPRKAILFLPKSITLNEATAAKADAGIVLTITIQRLGNLIKKKKNEH